MKKYLTIIFLVSLSALSCDKVNVEADNINACGVTTFDELTWAQALISGQGPCQFLYKDASITMYDYKGEKVFYFENPASSVYVCTRAVYNCSGTIIIPAFAEAKDWDDFETKRKNERLLWRKI
ncbi:MAG TPA: hypothetical protein VEV16_07345 [Daejeonella sp.]|nr:hypothetical protein [Daejeonella sp.]